VGSERCIVSEELTGAWPGRVSGIRSPSRERWDLTFHLKRLSSTFYHTDSWSALDAVANLT